MAEQKPPVLPASPSSSKTTESKWQPYEVDPEMANAKLANDLVTMCGRPGIVSKEFVIFHGILVGINHTDENKTYFDSSRIIAVFDGVFANTVNINGALFEKIWQYLMKPKMIIQGMPGQMSFQEEQKESMLDKFKNFFMGGGKKNDATDNK